MDALIYLCVLFAYLFTVNCNESSLKLYRKRFIQTRVRRFLNQKTLASFR